MNKKIWCVSAALLAGSVVFAAPEKSAKTAKTMAYVPSLVEQVLKVVVSGIYRNEYDKFHIVPFEKLPDVCKKACEGAKDIYGKEENTASVAWLDLDCDGSSEMIVTFRHYRGNGGTTYDVLTKRNGKWIKSDELFVVSWQPLKINGRVGLFLDKKCGWDQREYSFCEFKNGKLTPAVVINLQRYADKKKPRLTLTVNAAEEDGDMISLF